MSRASWLVTIVATTAAAQTDAQWAELVKRPRLTLAEAAVRGAALVDGGKVFQVELERDGDRLVYSVDCAQGARTVNVVLDIGSGQRLDGEVDSDDHSATVAAAKVEIAAAIEAAARAVAGTPVLARLRLRGGAPMFEVQVFDGGMQSVEVDGVTGIAATAGSDAQDGERRFTARFALAPGELVATGSNPWFSLQPGHRLVLEGKDGDEAVELVITVLDETRTIDGVQVRVVEERETKDGQLAEVSRNFFAISKITNAVYYFGEEVDMYRDGEVVSHEGAWQSGQGGARFGLMMPGTPLLGARYHQEVAPGVAMDRAEIVALDGVEDTPLQRYTDVLTIEETTPLEKGVERKYFARGVGLVRDGPLRLVAIGR